MVEAVLLVPVAMLVVLVAVQACLWVHAQTLASSAADQGDQVACTAGATVGEGVGAARSLLSSTAGGLVSSPSVRGEVLSGDEVRIQVTGEAESVVPWLRLPVAAARVGTKQEFRVSG
ncbi:MAG TPA: TadE/TadG family type IV pilus assembly protein [Acidimicrobiales bacterium]|nr:TadE/TadG family type IV pilus assembly protein [Acidimicrobiales bacterium]